MRNSSVLIWFWLLLIRNGPFLIRGGLFPMRNSSVLIWFWLLLIRNGPFLIRGGLFPMRNSSVLIWFWLLLIGNRSFLRWSALSPMRNSSFLIRVWFYKSGKAGFPVETGNAEATCLIACADFSRRKRWPEARLSTNSFPELCLYRHSCGSIRIGFRSTNGQPAYVGSSSGSSSS